MISIVICSRTTIIPNRLACNINDTIGVEHEIIVIDNSLNVFSIFEAYNSGLSRSRGELICFLHDDIIIHSQDWGRILGEIFHSNPEAGLIGVAGSKMKTKMPSAWWDCPEDQKAINIIQHFEEPNREKEKWYKGFETGTEVEVAVIDGVFMALRRDQRIKFNTRMTGFHNYDLNLALECHRLALKVIVTNRILLEHYSIGNQDSKWYLSTTELHKIYKSILPLNPEKSWTDCQSLRKQEFLNGVAFVKGLLAQNYKKQAVYYWLRLLTLKPYSKFHFNFLRSLILK